MIKVYQRLFIEIPLQMGKQTDAQTDNTKGLSFNIDIIFWHILKQMPSMLSTRWDTPGT